MAARYTKEQREARRQLGLRVAAERAERSRYYISFSFRPARTYPGRYGITAYVKGVWPILFRTEAEAWKRSASCRSSPTPAPCWAEAGSSLARSSGPKSALAQPPSSKRSTQEKPT